MLSFNHSGLRGAVTGISRASWIKKNQGLGGEHTSKVEEMSEGRAEYPKEVSWTPQVVWGLPQAEGRCGLRCEVLSAWG